MKLLCFGDSNTYGYDPRGFLSDRYSKDIRWTELLMQAGFPTENLGMNGREIPHRLSEITAAIQCFKSSLADRLLICLGSNDLLMNPFFTAEDVALRMEHFLLYLQKAFPTLPILLIAPVPMAHGEWVQEDRLLIESARLADHYSALTHRLNVDFADAGQWNVDLVFDGVHYSEAGHTDFAAGLIAWLNNRNIV